MIRRYPVSHRAVPRPIVGVHENVVAQIGMPKVDSDGLAELFYGRLGIPADVEPVINLRPLSAVMIGYHALFSREIHVDPLKTEHDKSKYPTMGVVIHEGKHLSDSQRHPVGMALSMVPRLGALGLGTYAAYRWFGHDLGSHAANLLPEVHTPVIDDIVSPESELSALISLATGGIIGSQAYYRVDPVEVRARNAQHSHLLEEYRDVITFPDAPRTAL